MKPMKTRIATLGLLIALCQAVAGADQRHTPESGSTERKAICDGARAHVMKRYVSSKTPLPQPLVFKIERIEVSAGYCSFEAIPVFKDGSPVGSEYVEDVVFNFCLKGTKDAWNVIYDFSRTDVPDDTELRQIWREFPKEFPFDLLPKFWRDLLNRVK